MATGSSIPIPMRIGDNVAVSQEKLEIQRWIQRGVESAKEMGYAPLQTSMRQPLEQYLSQGIRDAQANRIQHHPELDLRNGKAT